MRKQCTFLGESYVFGRKNLHVLREDDDLPGSGCPPVGLTTPNSKLCLSILLSSQAHAITKASLSHIMAELWLHSLENPARSAEAYLKLIKYNVMLRSM